MARPIRATARPNRNAPRSPAGGTGAAAPESTPTGGVFSFPSPVWVDLATRFATSRCRPEWIRSFPLTGLDLALATRVAGALAARLEAADLLTRAERARVAVDALGRKVRAGWPTEGNAGSTTEDGPRSPSRLAEAEELVSLLGGVDSSVGRAELEGLLAELERATTGHALRVLGARIEVELRTMKPGMLVRDIIQTLRTEKHRDYPGILSALSDPSPPEVKEYAQRDPVAGYQFALNDAVEFLQSCAWALEDRYRLLAPLIDHMSGAYPDDVDYRKLGYGVLDFELAPYGVRWVEVIVAVGQALGMHPLRLEPLLALRDARALLVTLEAFEEEESESADKAADPAAGKAMAATAFDHGKWVWATWRVAGSGRLIEMSVRLRRDETELNRVWVIAPVAKRDEPTWELRQMWDTNPMLDREEGQRWLDRLATLQAESPGLTPNEVEALNCRIVRREFGLGQVGRKGALD